MVTEPKIEDRKDEPYVGITMQEMGRMLPSLWGEVYRWLASKGVKSAAAPLWCYRGIDMAAKALIALPVLCVTISAMVHAQPTEKKTLAGVWEVKVSAGGAPTPHLLSIASFGGDGSFTTTGNTKFSLAPPNQSLADERGPGYGRWVQTGDREFKLTFYAVLLKEGEVNGYMRVRSTMILSESGNEFTARESQVDFLDPNWKVLDSDNDEVKGTRLETP
jgi:hypothetical protein